MHHGRPFMHRSIGPRYRDGRCAFTLWAPFGESVELELGDGARRLPMRRDHWGYWEAEADVEPGARYRYLVDGTALPDPASHSQPQGVHGPSRVVDHRAFSWHDAEWRGRPLDQYVIYELHTGIFTPEGSFDAVIPRLDELADLGITAVELMPVAQFPGGRNWGYDGVFPFAVQHTYGGPEGLKRLADACHRRGLALVLDVVYNHLGPEGNRLSMFGPYFTGAYTTFWGEALNFDREHSSEVRNYFVQNMLHWFDRYHADALRLDAVHAIHDRSARHLLRELAGEADRYSLAAGRRHLLIAESDLNDPRIVRTRERHGYGVHAQWSDDFHHALHALLTGERDGYYADFGTPGHLQAVLREGYCYTWKYSRYRKRIFGDLPEGVRREQLMVCSQNHDQVGNRGDGRRLSSLVSFEALKLAAGALLLGPFVPLLFMGQEYAEQVPFLYFVSHSDPDLVRAVREGRKKEFAAFARDADFPDPQAPETFRRCVLRWERRTEGRHGVMLALYRELLRLRNCCRAIREALGEEIGAPGSVFSSGGGPLVALRMGAGEQALVVMNFGPDPAGFTLPAHRGRTEKGGRDGPWKVLLASSDRRWDGPGPDAPGSHPPGGTVLVQPASFVLLSRPAAG
jgi:maltooligosyltrehalose trehalohydrolase